MSLAPLGPYGALAGGVLGGLSGLGDYSVNQNSLMGITHSANGGPPFVDNNGGANTRIQHRELITAVMSSTEFELLSFEVNPGSRVTFPWLSQIAANFEQYKWHGLVFYFQSTSANALNSTNTALGQVIMASDYNAAAPDFQNVIQMENTQYCVAAAPSCSQIAPIECAPREAPVKNWFVRVGPVPSGQDIRLYDLCKFELATTDSQAVAKIGYLWASYDIELMKPTVINQTPSGGVGAMFTFGPSTSLNNTAILGTSDNTSEIYNTAGITLGFGDGGTTSVGQIAWPAQTSGVWRVQLDWQSTASGTAGECANCVVGANTAVGLDEESLSSANSPFPGVNSNQLHGTTPVQGNFTVIQYVILNGLGTPSSLTFTSGWTLPGVSPAGNQGQLIIDQVPSDMLNLEDAMSSVAVSASDSKKCSRQHFDDLIGEGDYKMVDEEAGHVLLKRVEPSVPPKKCHLLAPPIKKEILRPSSSPVTGSVKKQIIK